MCIYNHIFKTVLYTIIDDIFVCLGLTQCVTQV